MDRHPVRTMSTSGAELPSRPFRVRQHDIDVFYALVGGAKSAANSKDQRPADPATTPPLEPSQVQVAAHTPASPVRRPPDPVTPATVAIAATANNVEGTGSNPADWAAALHGIAPAPRTPRPVSRTKVKPSRRNQVPWSPKVLCQHLVDRVDQLHVDSWVRKVSGDAMRRLGRAQTRLNGNRAKRS